ncbi:MAG: hypothetical protein ACLPYZ_02970 [Limisphaerales bacterium]
MTFGTATKTRGRHGYGTPDLSGRRTNRMWGQPDESGVPMAVPDPSQLRDTSAFRGYIEAVLKIA